MFLPKLSHSAGILQRLEAKETVCQSFLAFKGWRDKVHHILLLFLERSLTCSSPAGQFIKSSLRQKWLAFYYTHLNVRDMVQ